MKRAGSATVVAVAVVVVLTTCGMAAMWLQSGTARTHARVMDLRAVIELGESALGDAMSQVRATLASGHPTPDCKDDWRALMTGALAGGPLAEGRVVPARTRELLAKGDQEKATVGDVAVKIVAAWPAGTGADSSAAQLVLEAAVVVQGGAVNTRTKRTLRQRRIVHADGPTLVLVAEPLGTVLE